MEQPKKTELDLKIEAVYLRVLKGESDSTLLKNLLDQHTLHEDFSNANKQEILNRQIN